MNENVALTIAEGDKVLAKTQLELNLCFCHEKPCNPTPDDRGKCPSLPPCESLPPEPPKLEGDNECTKFVPPVRFIEVDMDILKDTVNIGEEANITCNIKNNGSEKYTRKLHFKITKATYVETMISKGEITPINGKRVSYKCDLEPGETVAFTAKAKVEDTAQEGDKLTSTVTADVWGITGKTNDSANIILEKAETLEISMSLSETHVDRNQIIDLKCDIKNTGNITCEDIVNINLSQAAYREVYTGDGKTIIPDTDTTIKYVPNLAAGETVTIEAKIQVSQNVMNSSKVTALAKPETWKATGVDNVSTTVKLNTPNRNFMFHISEIESKTQSAVYAWHPGDKRTCQIGITTCGREADTLETTIILYSEESISKATYDTAEINIGTIEISDDSKSLKIKTTPKKDETVVAKFTLNIPPDFTKGGYVTQIGYCDETGAGFKCDGTVTAYSMQVE